MVLRQYSQEKEIDFKPKEVMVQTQKDLELSLKRRSISLLYHKIWQAMQTIIQRNISQKCERGNFDKNTKAREP